MNRTTEWLNTNKYRSYPFAENSDFRIDSGAELPKSVLLDITVCDSFDGNEDTSVRLLRVTVSDSGSSILVFSYRNTEFEIPWYTDTDNGSAGYVRGVTEVQISESQYDTNPTVRYVIPEKVPEDQAIELEPGTYELKNPPEILQTRIIHLPGAAGVDYIKVDDTVATGKIVLGEGCNCDLSISDGNIEVTAETGAGKGQCCEESGDDRCANKLLFINGQRADSNGNINIIGGAGFNITKGSDINGIPSIMIRESSLTRALYGINEEEPIWTNPYVTDGLIAMWDGEWNAGGGIHDSSATSWPDIVGGKIVSLIANQCNGTFVNNGIRCGSKMAAAATSSSDEIAFLPNLTIEFALTLPSAIRSTSQYICCPFSLGSYFNTQDSRKARYGTAYLYSYPSVSRFFETITYSPSVCYRDSDNIITAGFHSFSFHNNERPMKDGIQVSGAENLRIEAFSYCEVIGQRVITFGGVYGTSMNYEQTCPSGTLIHCVRVYSRALTTAEIAHNYAEDKRRFNIQ